MRLLLDTHALLWWFFGQNKLSPPASAAIGDDTNDIFVSAASAWEISTKFRIGKLPDGVSVSNGIETIVAAQGFHALPVALRHGDAAGALPGLHKDPFDRMLIAQALLENLTLVSNEQLFDAYGVRRLW